MGDETGKGNQDPRKVNRLERKRLNLMPFRMFHRSDGKLDRIQVEGGLSTVEVGAKGSEEDWK